MKKLGDTTYRSVIKTFFSIQLPNPAGTKFFFVSGLLSIASIPHEIGHALPIPGRAANIRPVFQNHIHPVKTYIY